MKLKEAGFYRGPSNLLYTHKEEIFIESPVPHKAIISMSECSIDYANVYLPFKFINNIQVHHLSWKKIYELANSAAVDSGTLQKNLLKELIKYLEGIITMQTKESNWVYVVSLSTAKPENCDLTWIELVENKMKYFHPFGINGWPKEPPNYIGFRYRGRLQSIHHIESYTVTKNIHDVIEEMPDFETENEHFVHSLGKPIIPSKVIKTGRIYPSGRKWAMLDTLLTADTISEASEISEQRMNNEY